MDTTQAPPAPSIDTAPASAALFERASRVTPGGVNSPVRAMRSVGREFPIFLERGEGSRVWDADGTEYVDWVQSWGALPLGHANPEVAAAIARTAPTGTSFGAPTRSEVELAELVCELAPSVEMVRFCSSGTEATMSALRLARAATGRETVITFAGNYHGHADPFLATGGSGLATLSIPSSPGVPVGAAERTLLARYGDLASVEELAAGATDAGHPVAAIMLEPVAANMGVVEPPAGFLEGLRALCDRIGALLVFDEVITGFRVALGGAQERYGVHADLTCFGKVIGGGLPVGAFGGLRDLMQLVAPIGTMYQAGTLSGNPLAMQAGLTQLRLLSQPGTYELLEERGARLERALAAATDGARTAVTRVGSLVTLFHLGAELAAAPRDFDEARLLDTDAFGAQHAACLARGHYLPPSQFEALFTSTTHTDAMIESLGEAVAAAVGGASAKVEA